MQERMDELSLRRVSLGLTTHIRTDLLVTAGPSKAPPPTPPRLSVGPADLSSPSARRIVETEAHPT